MSDLKLVGQMKKVTLSTFDIDGIITICKGQQRGGGAGITDVRTIYNCINFLKSKNMKREDPPKAVSSLSPAATEEEKTKHALDTKKYQEEMKAFNKEMERLSEIYNEVELSQAYYLFIRSKLLTFKGFPDDNEKSMKSVLRLCEEFNITE